MSIDGHFGPDMVKDCVIQPDQKKVIMKFSDGDVQIAVAEEEDVFNSEVGILWATMKHLMHKYGTCSAIRYVKACQQKDKDRRNRKRPKKDRPENSNDGQKVSRHGKRGKRAECGNLYDDYCNIKHDKKTEDDDYIEINIKSNETIPESVIYCHPLMALQLISLFDTILSK